MVRPLIGSVEEGHELHRMVHEAVDLPLLQHCEGQALLQALQHCLQASMQSQIWECLQVQARAYKGRLTIRMA